MESTIPNGKQTVRGAELAGSSFDDVCLGEAKFDNVNLGKATFQNVNLRDARFDDVNLSNATITNANLSGMTINGVLVTDLLAAYARRNDDLRVIPELLCTHLPTTRSFYLDVLGFRVEFERPAETFIYLRREGVDLMFEQVDGPGRRWITGPLERPFGRGINLYIETSNVTAVFERVSAAAAGSIYLTLEDKEYRCGERMTVSRQFVVQDPDGYLLRFAQSIES